MRVDSLRVLLGITFFILSFSAFSAQIPAKVFGSLPDYTQLTLSPSGEKVAFLTRMEPVVDGEGSELDGTLVGIFDSKNQSISYPVKAHNAEFVISWIRWANDEKLLISADFAAHRYGVATVESRLLVLDIKTQKIKNLLHKSFYRRLDWMPQIQDTIVDILPDDPDHILLALDGKQAEPNVYKVHLSKKKIRPVQRSKKDVISWMTDRQHHIRLAIERKDASYRILERPVGEKEWRSLFEFEAFSAEQVWPLGFDHDGQILYVNAYHDGREAIFKVDLSTESLAKELVYANEYYDVDGGIIYSANSQQVIGTTFSVGGSGYTFWSEKHQALQRGINKALPDTSNYIVNFSADERQVLVLSMSDTHAGNYWYLDRDTKTFEPLAVRYKHLPEAQMAKKVATKYKARDGTLIDAFLTLPNGYQEGQTLATIVHPHGGPISYDHSGFDIWTQFFASRGYAVLQMNFRGSAGYGFDFMRSGLQNWGQAMQDDVEDGTRFLIEQGIADPNRICIVGASYGGYAALMGLVKSPDLYQCAVSFAGVTDLHFMMKKAQAYTNYDIAQKQIGSDSKQLKAVSPVNHVDSITKPVLLVHGDKDRSVLVNHSRKMFKKLTKAGKSVEYIELEDTDHHLSDNDGRIKTFEAMDAFLSRYLTPQTAVSDSAKL